MMVVIAIIIIITAVVITSQSSFNKTLVLANTAYDVALTIRLAETYGIGSHVLGGTVNTGYGIHFGTGTPNNTFTLFADTDPAVTGSGSTCHPAPGGVGSVLSTGPSALAGDCVYKPGSDITSQVYTLGNNITISNFCGELSNNTWKCSTTCGVASSCTVGLSSLDIVFSRPNPTPFMSEDGSYPDPKLYPEVVTSCIALTSAQGGFKYVSVGASGQISTNATSCP
jgi:hypothetical protein